VATISGLTQKYDSIEKSGYVMWQLNPAPVGYRQAHVTVSEDTHSVVVRSWPHLTWKNAKGTPTHLYFCLKGGEYVYLKSNRGKYETPGAADLALARRCVYDLVFHKQLPASEQHKVDIAAELERRRAEEAAATAAAVASHEARMKSDKASGLVWGKRV
jgi:hypothetical protein